MEEKETQKRNFEQVEGENAEKRRRSSGEKARKERMKNNIFASILPGNQNLMIVNNEDVMICVISGN